jgi:nitrate reductase NapAB chaperone NapD
VAASLKQIPGLDVEVADGARGEFTVLVDGQEVARKGEELPSVEKVVSAVKDVSVAKKSV